MFGGILKLNRFKKALSKYAIGEELKKEEKIIKIEENDGDFLENDNFLEEFKNASEKNLENAVKFFYHRQQLHKQNISGESLNLGENLERIILNPEMDSTEKIEWESEEEMQKAAAILDLNEKYYRSDVRSYVKDLEEKREEILKNSDLLKKRREISVKGRYQNFHFLNDVKEGSSFEFSLLKSGIKCAMIMSDTYHTRSSQFYKKIINILEKNKISFVEFTNIQPNLDRKLIFRMHEFARDHGVNSLIAIGSSSTIELSKLLLSKLMNPNIVNLHKTREFELAIAEKYSVFSIPTFVVPDPEVNSRSAIRNNLFAHRFKLWSNVLYLKNEIDDSDGVFYFSEIFDLMNREKILEILHETFFKLMFCYFDLSSDEDLLEKVVTNLKKTEKMLETFSITNEFNEFEKKEFIKIFSFTMDGRIIVDALDFWMVYKLEGALSLMVNSKKSEGLALFMPLFIEVMADKRPEFKKRLLELNGKFYGCYSVDGFIYRLLKHIQKYNLPTSLMDVQGVTKVNYKFLSDLMRYAKIGNRYSPIVKFIMQNLNVY